MQLASAIDSAESDPSPSPRFGEGEFPDTLDRLNWAAVLLGGIWALIHGVWRWFLLLVGVRLLIGVLFNYLGASIYASVPATVALVGVTTTLEWALSAVFGLRANRLAWAAEAERIASGRAQPPALIHSVGMFRQRQRTWLIIGLILVSGGLVIPFAGGPDLMGSMQLTATIVSVACMLAVLSGLWFYSSVTRSGGPS